MPQCYHHTDSLIFWMYRNFKNFIDIEIFISFTLSIKIKKYKSMNVNHSHVFDARHLRKKHVRPKSELICKLRCYFSKDAPDRLQRRKERGGGSFPLPPHSGKYALASYEKVIRLNAPSVWSWFKCEHGWFWVSEGLPVFLPGSLGGNAQLVLLGEARTFFVPVIKHSDQCCNHIGCNSPKEGTAHFKFRFSLSLWKSQGWTRNIHSL